MPNDEDTIETLEGQLPLMSSKVFAEARDRVLASGQSVLQTEGGYIVEVFPDGRKRQVKPSKPWTVAIPGTKLTIR